ncbi:FAD-dependent oxidoreductase [Balneola vulgaris]|uniref:FAD-dependent oxidoreductase n=1 Tax=Balneola vulgaris TaxID=287535 RepID=UPI00036241EC|nr:FAD-dependent oxidoreductase [Balneola vulgaris]
MNKYNSSKIAVIGAGISGITTATLLKLFGFEVTIYSEFFPATQKSNPAYASLYPSASVIPHSVSHDELSSLFEVSQALFKELANNDSHGVGIHEHYELYNNHVSVPEYAHHMENFEMFEKLSWFPNIPHLDLQSGWKYDCYFADWSIYFKKLLDYYHQLGGKSVTQKIDLNSPPLQEQIIINCTGVGASSLKKEHSSPYLQLGHLLKIKGAPLLKSPTGKTVSYNLTPGVDTYTNIDGEALDVYCYPRQDGWILGGSRFVGTIDKEGRWAPKSDAEMVFPHQITELNKEIIANTFGINLDSYQERTEIVAYRYVRDKKNGLKLEVEELQDQLMIHYYGLGGAGVTLSWGGAARILNMVANTLENKSYALNEIKEKLSRWE